MYGASPVLFLIIGLIVSSVAGIMNQDQELFFILMGLFGFFAFMGFIEQQKNLKDENKNLRRDLINRLDSEPRRKKKRKKRRK